MQFKELKQFVAAASRNVELLVPMLEREDYPEAGMRAKLLSATSDGDGIIIVTVDYTPFEAHNATLESANYFDARGNPTLTAREAGFYTPVEKLHFSEEEVFETFFRLLDENSDKLYQQFLTEAVTGESYTIWLEKQLSK